MSFLKQLEKIDQIIDKMSIEELTERFEKTIRENPPQYVDIEKALEKIEVGKPYDYKLNKEG